VLHALKSNDKVNVRALPHNFVYAYPTAKQLGAYMSNLAEGKSQDRMDTASRVRQMKTLSQRYSANFPIRESATNGVKAGVRSVVLVTGTTGYLGSHLLAQLLESDSFTKVYALNRPSSSSLVTRQQTSFTKRGLDTGLLEMSKLVLLEGDLNEKLLGLSEEVYNTIQKELTLIIHNGKCKLRVIVFCY